MNYISDVEDIMHRFSIRDIAIFKIYLIAVAYLAVIIFPVLGEISWIIYAVIAIITLVIVIHALTQKEENSNNRIFTESSQAHFFRKFSFLEMALFKIGMVAIGLLVANLFPLVLTAHIGRYIGIAAFGFGYFIGIFFHKR